MRENEVPALTAFLIEDVILALGNLRGSLGWLAAEAPDAGQMHGGLQRIGRQLDLIEDRARTIWRGLADSFGSDPPAPGAAPPEGAGPTLAQVLQDALGTDRDAGAPGGFRDPAMFRTRRRT